MKKLINSFGYACRGIKQAFISEPNMKIHVVIMLLVITAGFLLHINSTEWLICILCFGLVIASELFNTAIEKLVDLVSPQFNPKAGKIKDLSAGAVLVCAVCSAVAGLIIFLPKIWNLFL